MRSPARLWLFALASLGVAGCARRPTQVLLALDSDAPPDRAAQLTVSSLADDPTIDRLRAGGLGRTFSTASGALFPSSIAVVPPARGARTRTVTVRLHLRLERSASEPEAAIERVHRVTLLEGEARRARVFFNLRCAAPAEGCRSVSAAQCTVSARCIEQGQTCGDQGECVTTELDTSDRDAAVDATSDAAVALDAARDTTAQDPAGLPRMLSIAWSAGPELVRGAQEGALAMIDGALYHAGGYGQGVSEPVPEKSDRYPRGFSRQLEALVPGAPWEVRGAHPGVARQAHGYAPWRRSLIIAGGFNYDAPYTYADTQRLDTSSGQWSALAPLPTPVAGPALVVVGDTLYAIGGADYDSAQFHTEQRRDGSVARIGARVYAMQLSDGSPRWTERAALPGTPRFVHAVTAVGSSIYVLGGAALVTAPDGRREYCNVIDSWRYDTRADRWERVRDAPMAIGYWPRGRLTYRDRYVILPGGTHRPCEVSPEGVRAAGGGAHVLQLASYGVAHNVLVYDAATDRFGTASPMPIGNVGPTTIVEGATIHVVGGETGRSYFAGRYFANHPDLYLRGALSEDTSARDARPLAMFSLWPGRSLARNALVAEGTCDPTRGAVYVVGPETDPAERTTPCRDGFFSIGWSYTGPAGNRSIAVEQSDERGARTRGHDVSVYFGP